MTRIIGHRGARGLAPENTIAAIRKALEHNVDEIEIDVRVTKDSVPVLIHDRFLRDQTGKRFRVRDHTLEKLREHKPDLTTLADAIKVVDRAVPLLIEVKPGESTKPIVQVIKERLQHGGKQEDFAIGSFSQRTLKKLHAALPDVQKVVIERFFTYRAMWRARAFNTHRLNMSRYFLWSGSIAALHRRGFEVYPYTLNDPRKAAEWVQHGLAGVITDLPSNFKEWA